MPSFSRHLEESLHRAVAFANQRKHEYATREHLPVGPVADDEERRVGIARLNPLQDIEEEADVLLLADTPDEEEYGPGGEAGESTHARRIPGAG